MKRLVSVLVITLFATNFLCAQDTETLTNSTIIMMVKAKLSDDLIIDQIHDSKTKFNLSNDSINFLSSQNVSSQVIQAMKAVGGTQISTDSGESKTPVNPVVPESVTAKKEMPIQPETAPVKDTLKQPTTDESILAGKETSVQQSVQANDSFKQQGKKLPEPKAESVPELSKEKSKTENTNNELIEKSTLMLNAISYTVPMENLITFFDNEFNILLGVFQVWDKRIRDSIEKVNQIKDKIQQIEKELADKKNADSKGYSNVILVLKKELSTYREKYKQAKTNMFTDGMNIAKECKSISSELDQSINGKFSEVSNSVRKVNPDPAKGEIIKTIPITKQKFNGDIVNYVASTTQILFFCQNEIISIQNIIILWNEKALAIIQKDSELSKQLEPLKKELENLKSDPKMNKKEISELKKQCAKIDKERKQLEDQMVDDSKELSEYLKKIGAETQSATKERFTDIIEDINFSYQDKF